LPEISPRYYNVRGWRLPWSCPKKGNILIHFLAPLERLIFEKFVDIGSSDLYQSMKLKINKKLFGGLRRKRGSVFQPEKGHSLSPSSGSIP